MAEKNMNAKISVEFEETANRQQLFSGDNLPTLFGKIKKIISDLSTSAFSGSYNDLSDTPSTATTDTDGLMSATDKAKLDGIEANANYTVVDAELSETSENPVQNKVIAELLNQIGGGIKVITGSYTTGQYTGSTSTINIGAKPIAFFITPDRKLNSDSIRNVFLCIGDQIVTTASDYFVLQITDYGFSHISPGGKQKYYYLAIVNE